jgi:integrase/recombinase XerD
MLKDSFEGVTISVYLDTRKKLKSLLFPVKIRVTYNRTSQYFPTGKDLSEEDWHALPVSKKRELSEIRKDVAITFDNVKDVVRGLVHSGDFTFEQLKQRLGSGNNISLNTLFVEKIKELSGEDRIGSLLHYQYALDTLVKHYGENIPFEAVTSDWLKKHEKKLAVTLNVNTIGMQMRTIRAIMNIAKKRMYIKENQYPFGEGKYEIKKGASVKKALSIQQIGEIAKYKEGSKAIQFHKDVWLFSYLCNGINPADLIKLKYSNIVDGEIVFIRQKTEHSNGTVKIIRAPVLPLMQEIIGRWGNEPSNDAYIFPILKGGEDAKQRKTAAIYLAHKIREKMKIVGEALGIGSITCYTARHSFATVLKRSGANIASISESLGHSDLKTTEHYLASFEREERDKNANLLTNFD